MRKFSALQRPQYIKELQETEYDLLIIGGGITGAGIALDAVSRGLRVAMIEKEDFAWGTSSRSTKLIHGGLRYLKQFEINLVREVGLERAVVYNNAKHIVRPEKMLLPIVKGGSLGKSMSSLGLWVYDFLADVRKDEKRRMLDAAETQASEPLLRTDILKGGGLYYEYRSDDARLTIENIKTAFGSGANCLNYVEALDFILDENGKIEKVKVKDHITGDGFEIKAKIVVNAAGPWVDTIRTKGGGKLSNKRLQLTKGVHIVVPREKLPLQQSVYFDVEEDNRMVFAIPRGKITYIGTTDTHYSKDIGHPNASIEDVEYILRATNFMFPSVKLLVDDVISTWSGLRPLIHEEGKDPSELSRKDEIFYSDNGLVSIAGGKLTGYRKMAERVTDVVIERLGNKVLHIKECHTEHISLGGNFSSEKEMEEFIISRTGESKQIGLDMNDIVGLSLKYGKEIDLIIGKAYELHPMIKNDRERIWVAELWYSIHHEMSMNPSDFFIRRTGRLYFDRPSIPEMSSKVFSFMAKKFHWDEKSLSMHKEKFEKAYKEVLSFSSTSTLA